MNVSRTLVAACLCSVSTAAFATSFEVPIAGTQSLSLAVASPALPSGDPDHVAGRVHDLIEHDLDMSGYFTIVPTSAHLDTRSGSAPGEFSFDDWKPLRVGALVNAKPDERRQLLEEAAGITGLHSRRHEAELRLRAAETNLTRLDDVTGELETALNRLKREAPAEAPPAPVTPKP